MIKEKRAVLSVLVIVLLCCAGVSYFKAEADPQTARPQLNIAVVDLPQLLSGMSEWKDDQDKLRQKNQQMERVVRTLRRKINVIKEEMKDLAPGTEERAEKEEEMERASVEVQSKMRLYERQMKRLMETYSEEIYRKVLDEIGEYAKAEGIDLVLKKQGFDSAKTRGSVTLKMEMNTVLYSGGRADITKDLVEILNRKYTKSVEVK